MPVVLSQYEHEMKLMNAKISDMKSNVLWIINSAGGMTFWKLCILKNQISINNLFNFVIFQLIILACHYMEYLEKVPVKYCTKNIFKGRGIC